MLQQMPSTKRPSSTRISHHPTTFFPSLWRHWGCLGKDAHSFFKEVARRVKLATDDDFAYQSMVQRISVAVQGENTAAVLRCSGMRGGV